MPTLLTNEAKRVSKVTPIDEWTMPDRCYLCCYIRLNKDMVALVDPQDWARLHKYYWFPKKTRNGYYAARRVRHYGKRKLIYMHREIAGTPPGMETHHKNRFKLDCRSENLEIVTPETHDFIRRRTRKKCRLPNAAVELPI